MYLLFECVQKFEINVEDRVVAAAGGERGAAERDARARRGARDVLRAGEQPRGRATGVRARAAAHRAL